MTWKKIKKAPPEAELRNSSAYSLIVNCLSATKIKY